MKLSWLGSTNRETNAHYVWHATPVQSLADAMKTEVVIGAQAPGSTQYDYPVLANALFGFKFKVITGYEATPKIHLAMERGEVHGTLANWSTLKAINLSWITDKKIKILAQWALRKHPEMGDVPLALDLAKTDADKQAMLLALARLEYGRPFFLPPNVPADRLNALRARIRRHHEGSGLSGRGREAQDRRRSADRRAGRRAGRAGLPHAHRCRHARAHRDGWQVATGTIIDR